MAGIDHVVHAVADLDRAAQFFERLGFTLTPRAQHPFGTGNRLAQLQGCFIELLAVTKPGEVPEAKPGEFSFGAYNRDFLASDGEGMSMLALTSEGWEEDRARLAARGFDLPAPFGFGRTARQPDGKEVKLDFRLTFAAAPEFAKAQFFTCDHRHPAEVFWKPAYQAHANGAERVVEVLMVAEIPEIFMGPVKRLFGGAAPILGGVCAGLDGAGLCILEPDASAETYPKAVPPVPAEGQARFAGYRIRVADLGAVEALWTANEVPFRRVGDRLYITADGAYGALLAFSED